METTTLLNSNTSALPKHEICLTFDEVIETMSEFLQPGDEQERHDLSMFLSQVDELHKPIANKLNARFVFNFLERMLKPSTPTNKGPSEVTFPEQLQELTENIAIEIASSAINGVDSHYTTISVFNVLQEVSWETKAALMITTFVLTFGDKGLNLCEESKVSVNEIQMFPKLKEGFKHQLEGSKNLFILIYEFIGSILQFEDLTTKYMISKDPKVKLERTQLIVVVYWITRIIVAAALSYIITLSSRGYEFEKTISTLWELPSKWSKKLEELRDQNYLLEKLLLLQGLLKEDVDIEAYNNIKKIIEQGKHNDNMIVLNALIPSVSEDTSPLYDCLRKQKVDLNELKGERVLLFISELENIAPEVDETKLNEFINSYDRRSVNQVECKIVWMPVVNVDRSLHRTEAMEVSTMLKPFLHWYYLVHYTKLLEDVDGERNFKGWYSVSHPSRMSNEVKKLIRDDWKCKKGEPIIVVLDPQGNIVHHNVIHLFYNWGVKAFPFTRKDEKLLYDKLDLIYDLWDLVGHGWNNIISDWRGNDDWIFLYGGENMEWIMSFTRMVHEAARELGEEIMMVYVGRSHNQEMIQSVIKEKLSHCLSDQFYLWMFWRKIESFIYSFTHMGIFDTFKIRIPQYLLYWDKSHVGWALIFQKSSTGLHVLHGKVVLSTLKKFQLWKERASQQGFLPGFIHHYYELDEENLQPFRDEFPTTAVNEAPIALETLECPVCKSQMERYTTFVCYHPPSIYGDDHKHA